MCRTDWYDADRTTCVIKEVALITAIQSLDKLNVALMDCECMKEVLIYHAANIYIIN